MSGKRKSGTESSSAPHNDDPNPDPDANDGIDHGDDKVEIQPFPRFRNVMKMDHDVDHDDGDDKVEIPPAVAGDMVESPEKKESSGLEIVSVSGFSSTGW